MSDNDLTAVLQQAVLDAVTKRTPLQICGGQSKSFYGRNTVGTALDVSLHQGIISYQPTELVLTARTGTRLSTIQRLLAQQRQMLAFEPPHFKDTATLGGTIACGFSGPRRPFTGSARDFVLGCKIINGKGEILSFGGQVMKNVAGYDVSRLMAGALGTLGVLLEVSLKVLPLPAFEQTRCFELDLNQAKQKMVDVCLKSLPISGLSYDGRFLYLRLSGTEKSIQAAGRKLGGNLLAKNSRYWEDLCEHQLDFFDNAVDLWRISVAPATPELKLTGTWYYDWGGALRWLKTEQTAAQIFAAADKVQGHALLFSGKDRSGDVFHPLSGKLKLVHQNLKQAFDPMNILNPGRLYKA